MTELVINALKHAFPDHRHGEIKVGYSDNGTGWKLTVADDGVGMPGNMAEAKAGLGTTIVNALAKQLHVTVHVEQGGPGTAITVNQTKLRLIDGAPQRPRSTGSLAPRSDDHCANARIASPIVAAL